MPRIPGVTLPDRGAPRQSVTPCTVPDHVGLIAADYPGLRLRARVEEGDSVAPGQAVLQDSHDGGPVLVSPVAGQVAEIVMGPRRMISRLVIRREGAAEPLRFDTGDADSRDGLRRLLLTSGLWAAILRRPFGKVPDRQETPAAILVSAMTTEPGAPDPAPLIAAERAAFDTGLDALARLTDGSVFVCHGTPAAATAKRDRVIPVRFSGPHPAGATGIHAERLCPATRTRPVWQISYADVLALGTLLTTGSVPGERTVSISGEAAAVPRLLRLPLGADIEALAGDEALGTGWRLISGSSLCGVDSRFLRRRHLQITLSPGHHGRAQEGRRTATPLKRAALIPHAGLMRALGPDLPAIALLRALSVGDLEQAERAGALGLLEDDMALATYLTGGGEDFATRLRAVLDRLEAA